MKAYGVATAAVVAGLLMVQSASALEIRRFDGFYGGIGGEFTVFGTGYEANYATVATYSRGRPIETGFQTYCLEKNESQVTYPDAFSIESYAIDGGVGGPSPDPISIGTAWLYNQFALGLLAATVPSGGYDYNAGPNRSASAVTLQEAFWWLEEELGAIDASGNEYIVLAAGALGMSASDLRADAAYRQFGVAVINFTETDATTGAIINRQSMLVRVPDGGLTVVLLGFGVLGCAALRRRLV